MPYDLNETDRRVLSTLWRLGEASRVEISHATGLTKPTITGVVNMLTERGLVVEREPRRGLRGQPARPVALVPQAFFSAGVNFSHSYLDAGIVDMSGELLKVHRADLEEPTIANIAAASFELVETLIGDLALDRRRVLGVGFTAPGDLQANGGLAAHALFPDLVGIKMREALSEHATFPVFVENDGRACAIGESVIGAGRSASTFMLVHIGHGVGGGLIIEGKPLIGAHGNAGPLGGFFPLSSPRPSGQDLFNHLEAHGVACNDFNQLEALSPADCTPLSEWLDRASEQLQHIVPGAAVLVDPGLVVLGGRLPPNLLEYIVERIDMKAFVQVPDQIERATMVASVLGSRAGVVGAALLPIHAGFLPQR